MKKLISAFLLTFLALSFARAHTGESKTIQWDGSSKSETLQLRGSLTHTEYRIETVANTCYRQEFIGTYCSREPQTSCREAPPLCEDVQRCKAVPRGSPPRE